MVVREKRQQWVSLGGFYRHCTSGSLRSIPDSEVMGQLLRTLSVNYAMSPVASQSSTLCGPCSCVCSPFPYTLGALCLVETPSILSALFLGLPPTLRRRCYMPTSRRNPPRIKPSSTAVLLCSKTSALGGLMIQLLAGWHMMSSRPARAI